jgi:putative ABC transport system permease protein
MFQMVKLSYPDLLGVVMLVLLAVWLCLRYRVGIAVGLLIGLLRSFLQLLAVGYILVALFASLNRPLWVIAAVMVMVLTASMDGGRRAEHKIPGRYQVIIISILAPVVLVLTVAMLTSFRKVIQQGNWYEPRYLIPLAGMTIAQALNSVALAMNRVCAEILQQRPRIETALALGATSEQAVSGIIRQAVKAAMVPPINMMMVVGVVHIPGIMSGMILHGANPHQAVVCQLVVIYMIVGVCALSALMCAHLTSKLFFTASHQLRYELMQSR